MPAIFYSKTIPIGPFDPSVKIKVATDVVVRNTYESTQNIYQAVAELNPGGTIKDEFCRVTCDNLGYHKCAGNHVSQVTGECRQYEVCSSGLCAYCKDNGWVEINKPPGKYYYGVKTWGADEGEPNYSPIGVILDNAFSFEVVIVAPPSSHTFSLIVGDNYISLPYLLADATPSAVFGSDVTVLTYKDPEGWASPATLVCKKGYFLLAPNAKSVTVTGTECVITVADLIAIYNSLSAGQSALVGAGNADISVVGTVLEGKVQGYNPNTKEFEYVNLLKLGKGYWIEKEALVTTITFVTKNQDGTELKGVSVYINEAYKGVT